MLPPGSPRQLLVEHCRCCGGAPQREGLLPAVEFLKEQGTKESFLSNCPCPKVHTGINTVKTFFVFFHNQVISR